MRTKRYPSDISRKQFAIIQPLLEGARRRTKPRTVDLYDVFCAVLYLLKSGCQWRMLPTEFPKWRTVHEYFRIWSQPRGASAPSLLEEILKKIGWRGPVQTGAARHDEFLHRGCTEREEHGHGRSQGV